MRVETDPPTRAPDTEILANPNFGEPGADGAPAHI